MNTKLVLIVLAVIVGVGGWYWSTTTFNSDFAGWTTYTNKSLGIELAYPTGWQIRDSSRIDACGREYTSVGLRSPVRYDFPGYSNIAINYVLNISSSSPRTARVSSGIYGYFDAPELPHNGAVSILDIPEDVERVAPEYKIAQQVIASYRQVWSNPVVPIGAMEPGKYRGYVSVPCHWHSGSFGIRYNAPILFCPEELLYWGDYNSDPRTAIVCMPKDEALSVTCPNDATRAECEQKYPSAPLEKDDPTQTQASIILYKQFVTDSNLTSNISNYPLPNGAMYIGSSSYLGYPVSFHLYLADQKYQNLFDLMVKSFDVKEVVLP